MPARIYSQTFGVWVTRTLPALTLEPQTMDALAVLRADWHAGVEAERAHPDQDRIVDKALRSAAFVSDLDSTHLHLLRFFDQRQLSSMLDGSRFSFGVGELESCVYAAGSAVHLRPAATMVAAWGLEDLFGPPGGDRHPLCSSYRSAVSVFDDESYLRIASGSNDLVAYRHGLPLTPRAMLQVLCGPCLRSTGSYRSGAVCVHGAIGWLCTPCRELRNLAEARLAELCRTTTAQVSALIGSGVVVSAAVLRTHPRHLEIWSLLDAALDAGVKAPALISGLGWPAVSFHAFVRTGGRRAPGGRAGNDRHPAD